MSTLVLSRLQFALTTVYHFFFVPLTLGLSILVAILETLYVCKGDDKYKRMAKFWGKLFVINFALGMATGIVQEFQFGMNWSEYSRFVGDIFGAPLAIEGLLAFFLESTFLGIWLFGWEKLPKALHAATIWLVALGSSLSAFWILVANSFMHQPVGYTINEAANRAEMSGFGALLGNPHLWYQFPHVLFAGITTAGFFVLGISAYHLLKKSKDPELFRRSFTIALVFALVGSVTAGFIGHLQGQYVYKIQPMKIAASEAHWETQDPAKFVVVAGINQAEGRNTWELTVPRALSFLLFNRFSGEVTGLHDLQAQAEQQYGAGDYVPPVAVTFWTFRVMVGVGMLMILLALAALYLVWRKRLDHARWFLHVLPFAMVLPYLATSTGWILTEMGRQPWIVYGVLKTEQGVSPISGTTVLISLLAFALLYAALIVANVYLMRKYAVQPQPAPHHEGGAKNKPGSPDAQAPQKHTTAGKRR
jgi:cytochrome d ubiquinol oxidase subunit I